MSDVPILLKDALTSISADKDIQVPFFCCSRDYCIVAHYDDFLLVIGTALCGYKDVSKFDDSVHGH